MMLSDRQGEGARGPPPEQEAAAGWDYREDRGGTKQRRQQQAGRQAGSEAGSGLSTIM